MVEKTEHVELIAKKEGTYTVYVFENVRNYQLIMCTKLPNWQVPELNIGIRGYVSYQVINAGEKYFNKLSQKYETYSYSNVYFQNFINEPKIKNNRIEL